MTNPGNVLVSVVLPCRNEARYIRGCLNGILSQDALSGDFEIIVADGMSDDGTTETLAQMSHADPRIRIIENHGKIVSTGLNAAIRKAHGEIIIRMDAHTEYAQDYIKRCVAVLQSVGAGNVGGPWQARGHSYLQYTIALAFQSVFSSGGAGSHRIGYEGPVDSVYLGCWRKETLLKLGLFDEELVRNQDDELNLRLIRAGGSIWQSPTIRSWYYPRSSLRALFTQYMQYGYWKVRVIRKHRLPASIRHLVPGGFVASLLVFALVAPWFRWGWLMPAALLGLYLCTNLATSLITCRTPVNWKYLPVMPFVFAAYHFGYGWGFLRGVLDFVVLKKGGRASYGELTR
jgi:glycosyltransferase involved in cell wall biosynthesis